MNFNEMAAGPEMDRLVAELVMGWKQWQPLTGFRPSLDRWLSGDDGIRTTDPAANHDRGFYPSTDIAHAWEVVEHLRSRHGLSAEVLMNPGHIRVRINYGEVTSVLADTAPLAICRAALLATNPTEES